MLSVILYGRNDAHGYNLHKRGALSLNCIAEVLRHPSDELIFVDYNTPDELPTFPEALADTLTDQCKKRLRIIRVRGDFHKAYAAKTRLVALECQSRNIAIRRSNPENNWILSTNTDMIFCPTDPFASLGDIVSSLDEGYYHLPRFEVPEGFWERMDRSKPAKAIRSMRDYGVRYHINEIVYGFYDNLYEGPGDFQLFRREDIFKISGFDERMILGWHADANMARRMRLLRGEVRTAVERVYGYHCGHTRQATSLHKGVRIENDQIKFIADVATPFAPWQAENWGAPDVEFEEIRLDARDPYFRAMKRGVAHSGPEISEARLSLESYGKVAYSADHVLPHLCDLVFNLPARQTILFYGDDVELLKGVRSFLEEAGKEPQFIVTEESQAAAALVSDVEWKGRIFPLYEGAQRATVFLVQYPSYADGQDRYASWLAEHALKTLVAAERQLPSGDRHRVIVVNGIHNAMAPFVEASLAPTSMPFSSRLRQGFVTDRPRADFQVNFSEQEHELLAGVISGITAGEPLLGWERVCSEVREVAQDAARWAAFGLTKETAAAVELTAHAALEKALSRTGAASAVRTGASALTRLCSGNDWLSGDWRQLAQSLFGQRPSRFLGRTRWAWERLAILQALCSQLPIDALENFGGRKPKVLIVAMQPDLVAPMACSLGYQVEYVTAGELLNSAAEAPQGWSELFATQWLNVTPFHAHHFHAAEPRELVDAVVFVSSWVESGRKQMDALLEVLSSTVKDRGLFIATAQVQLSEHESDGAVTLGEWAHLFEDDGPVGARGFVPRGEVDTHVPVDTLVRFGPSDDEPGPLPILAYGQDGLVSTSGIICAEWPRVLCAGPLTRAVFFPPWEEELRQRLGRRSPLLQSDRELLKKAIKSLIEDRPLTGWERLAPELGAIAACGDEVHKEFDLHSGQAEIIFALAKEAMYRALSVPAVCPEPCDGRDLAGTRLCSGVDWENSLWAETALGLFSPTVLALQERSRWIWERTSLLEALERDRPTSGRPRVLLLAAAPDALGHLLAHRGYETICVTTEELEGISDLSKDWSDLIATAWLPARAPVGTWAVRGEGKFDVVVTTARGLLDYPSDALDRLLSRIDAHMSEGASIYATFNVSLDGAQRAHAVSLAAWLALYSDQGLLGGRGFKPRGEVDFRVPLDTVLRRATGDAVQDTVPGLSFTYGDGQDTVALTSAEWPKALTPVSAAPTKAALPTVDFECVQIPYINVPS